MYDKNPARILNYHRSMLTDQQRTLSLKQAIDETVKPGDIVLDLGCGTGILSCFACRAGAQKVYAIEMGPVIELAKAICKLNGFSNQVEFFNQHSSQVNLPEPVDVMITETIGNFGLEEGILEWVVDAKKRFLKPGGKIIPQTLGLVVAPVEQPKFYEKVSAWENLPYDLNFKPARSLAANNIYWENLAPESFLASPAPLLAIDLTSTEQTSLTGRTSLQIERNGVIHGIGGWFSAQLTANTFLTNAPPNQTPSWAQAFFPLANPLPVRAGDQLQIEIQSRFNASLWIWQIEAVAAANSMPASSKVGKITQSTFSGKFFSPALLGLRGASRQPQRNQKGDIALQVLSAMDSSRTLTEIAQGLLKQFPGYFREQEQALNFVRHISQQYGTPETGSK